MKIQNLILSFFAVMMFAACNVIPEDDRLIEVELMPSDRTVLLVEFTGNRCVNCPGAAMVAHEMLEISPENIVVVGMHPAGIVYTNPMDPNIDLSSAEAMEYLRSTGKVVYLSLPYEEGAERLGDLNARGVTLKPGQTLQDLYAERVPLYEKYAHITIACSGKMLREIVAEIAASSG